MAVKDKREYYFIQINLRKRDHQRLIDWIKAEAAKNEQSLSSFCVKIIKDKMQAEVKE